MGLPLRLFPARAETGVLREARQLVEVDMETKPTTDEVFEALMADSRIPLAEVKQHPHGKLFETAPVLVAPADANASDRLDVANGAMMQELASIREEDHEAERGARRPFRLISRRLPNAYNSSGRDLEALTRKRAYNPAFVHPDDLRELDLRAGDRVQIVSDRAAIVAVVEPAPELRRGVVSMAHGFGDAPERDHEHRLIGSSTARLIDNEREFDPHTGIPRMSALPVSILPHRD